MELGSLHLSLQTSMVEDGYYGLSFWGDNELSLEETCVVAEIPHAKVRVSTVGRLRERRFDLTRSEPYPHLDLRFEVWPTDNRVEELIGLFDSPIPNPGLEG